MRKIVIIVVAAVILTFLFGQAQINTDAPPIKVRFVESNHELLSLPGVEVRNTVAVENQGRTDTFVFIKISIPVVEEEDVVVSKEDLRRPDGFVPVVIYTVQPGWTMLQESISDDTLTQIYFYGEADKPAVLKAGEVSDPLMTTWHITNFAVVNNQCKNYSWEELGALLTDIDIFVHSIQTGGFKDTAPATLWSLCQ